SSGINCPDCAVGMNRDVVEHRSHSPNLPFRYDGGRGAAFWCRRRDELRLGQLGQIILVVVGGVERGGKFLLQLGRDGAAHPAHLDEDRMPVLVASLHASSPTALLMTVRALPEELFTPRVIREPLEYQRRPSV